MAYKTFTRSGVALIVAVFPALLLSGCGAGADDGGAKGSSPQHGGTLTVLRAADIDSWDPDKALLIETFETLPQVMPGLVRPSADGTSVEPGLAESWDLDPDRNTLTFHLRPDLEFSNGEALTSADVAFSVDIWREGVSYGTLYSAIEGIRTPDDSTVVLELGRPSTFTLSWLANGTAVVVPEDFGGMSREEFFEEPIGAGPFVVDEHVAGESLTLARNDNYYDADKAPYLDELVYRVVSDPNQQLLQFQSGQAQMLESVPLDIAGQLDEDERHVVTPSATVHAAFINTAEGPGVDLHFRRAVSYAIDRATYTESVFGGYAAPATGGLPTGVQGSAPCDCEYEGDLDKAKEELELSDYDGSDVVILVDSASPVSTRGGEVLVEMLKEIGVTADLQPEEAQVMFDRYSKGDYDIELAEVSSVSPSVGDIFGLVSYMVSASDEDEVIPQAFDELDVAPNEGAMQAATRTAENWIGENLPYVPIAYPDRVYAVDSSVGGLEVTPFLYYRADRLWVG